jgi:hypothetical protein
MTMFFTSIFCGSAVHILNGVIADGEKRLRMLRRAIIFLLAVGFFSCSQPADDRQEAAESGYWAEEPARVRFIWIEPAHPTSFSNLKAEVEIRGDPKARLGYQWLKNDEPIPGAIQNTLAKKHFNRGDFISIQVWVVQPGSYKNPVSSDVVMIGNTPPAVEWVVIGPAPPTSTSELKAVASGKDMDNDAMTYTYEWIVNGETVVGPEGPSLLNRYFHRGDEVQVAATAFDGTDWGQPNTSIPVIIQNSPPMIVSKPPAQLEEGTTYRYAIKAEDVDGDTLSYSLQGKPPEGMVIDPETGIVEWQVVIPEKPVTYEYEVVVMDPEGGKSVQKITLKNAP